MIGNMISHYNIIAKLGEDELGSLLKARDANQNRTVILKVLHNDLVRGKAREEIKEQINRAAKLTHPNICKVLEIEDEKNYLILVMEKFDGRTFLSILGSEGPLPIRLVINIAVQLSSCLYEAHSQDFIHGELNCSNIILTEQKQVKILCFGLRGIGGTSPELSLVTAKDSIAYNPPEKIRNHALDAKSDIWSLGVILYHILTNNLPFKGKSPAEVMYSILTEEPVPIEQLREKVPSGLWEIIKKTLTKDLKQRYSNALELNDDLKKVKETTFGPDARAWL